MHILICTPEFPPLYSSGIGNVVFYLKKEFENSGIKCSTCSTLCADINLADGLLIKNFANIRSLYVSYFWHQALKFVKKNKDIYDLIWVHDPMPYFLKSFPKEKELVITYHTVHSAYLAESRYPRIVSELIKKMEIESFRKVANKAKIAAVSEKVIKELADLGLDEQRIKYIPNGVDIDNFKPSCDKCLCQNNL